MALEIADLTGTVLPVSGTNPYGYVVDAPGGTVVDKLMVGDALVFFQRLMAEAGVVPNNLPDNATNTFQLWVAFQLWVNPPWTNSGAVFENDVPGNNEWDNAGGAYGKFHYRVVGNDQDGLVFFSGVVENTSAGSPASPLIMNVPAAIRPTYTTVAMAWDDTAAAAVQIEIRTNGDVVPLSTASGGTKIFLDGLCYRLGPNTY
jgi:hypothetical protein